MRRVFVVFWVLVAGFAVPAPIGAQGCDETVGRTERASYRSGIAQTTMHYTVVLPPCYDAEPERVYPALYLMHGSAQFDDHWLQVGVDDALYAGIVAGELPPMIVVLPYGEWIANENQFGRVSFENVFIEELLPAVANAYRVAETRDQRAIGGISRGGFWAFEIAFRHPDLFGTVGGHSPFFDPFHAPETHNPLDLALNAPGIDALRIAFDRGADDYAFAGMDAMDANLQARGLDYTYTVHPEGQHDNRYWAAHVADYLAYYAEPWQPQAATTPPTPNPDAFVFTPPKQQPDPNTFTFTPPRANTPSPAQTYDLYLPVVAFNSTQARMSSDTLAAAISGAANAMLVLDDVTAARLAAHGMTLAPGRTVPADELERMLWADRRLWTILPFERVTPRYRALHIDGVHPLLVDDLAGYPLALPGGDFDPGKLTSLTLSGVTAITRQSIPPIDQNGVEWAASGIAPFTNTVDFFHTSNEVSFTEACPQATETPLGAFCSKAAHFPILQLVGADIIELSGNHNNDYGYTAYLDTLARFEDAGMVPLGGGRTPDEAREPYIITHGGSTIGMVACNDVGPFYAIANDERPGSTDCNANWLRPTLERLSGEVDLVVLTVQHLEIEDYFPGEEARLDFRQWADWGADVVVGTQAHKPQTFQFYPTQRGETAFIHYGLGNLFFDQPFWGNSRFWMDTLFVYDGRLMTVDLFTGIIDEQARPRPMTDEEQKNFLEFMFLVNNGVE